LINYLRGTDETSRSAVDILPVKIASCRHRDHFPHSRSRHVDRGDHTPWPCRHIGAGRPQGGPGGVWCGASQGGSRPRSGRVGRFDDAARCHNDYAKNPLAEGIESAGSRRIRGIAAPTILLAYQLTHANRRKIKRWLDTLALNSERPRRRTHHRRKTEEPRSWTPAGYLVPAA
jgi:hypothetical protein